MNTLQLDFEFFGSNEPHVTPVCAVIRILNTNVVYRFPRDRDVFVSNFKEAMTKNIAIIAYYASAEARALSSLGFTPTEMLSWTWLDPYILWRMLTFSHPDYRYGEYIDKSGEWKRSTPPPFKSDNEADNENSDDVWVENEEGDVEIIRGTGAHKPLGRGLYDVLAARYHMKTDKGHKNFMRDLILDRKGNHTEEEWQRVLLYCQEDVVHLKRLFTDLYTVVHEETEGKCGIEQVAQLSRYSVCCGIMENTGIPLDVKKLETLGHNYFPTDDELITRSKQFYYRRKSTKKERSRGEREFRWVESQSLFNAYLISHKYTQFWPTSEKTGKFKKNKETLKTFSADDVIDTFRHVKSSRNNIKYFRPDGLAKIKSNIGSDGRIRVLLSPFGSKTGRNQPRPAEGYIYGMSTWLRPLIEDPTKTIIGGDFSAQEIALQGHISGDDKFLQAYASGDPYTWFSQVTKAMPSDIVRSRGQFYKDNEPVDTETKNLCKSVRASYKAVLLGVGFGMGLVKLAASITLSRLSSLPPDQQDIIAAYRIGSTDPDIIQQAEDILRATAVSPGKTDLQRSTHPKHCLAVTYLDYHQKIFAKYWSWRKWLIKNYNAINYITLKDGWSLLKGEGDNSVANFPIQGSGGAILRKAVENCILSGLSVISPLHDCIYIVTDDETRDCPILEKCMKDAVNYVCGDENLIRIDLKKHETNWETFESTYTEDKQADVFKVLGKYMITKIL